MLITLIILGAIGAAAAGGTGLHRKAARRKSMDRSLADFETMLQDAGFVVGTWNGWNVKSHYYFTSRSNLNLNWRTIRRFAIAFIEHGCRCPACSWPTYRLCRPYDASGDGERTMGQIGSICSNLGCGRLIKDGDMNVPASETFRQQTDTLDVLEIFRRQWEEAGEQRRIEAVRRETAALDAPPPPLALPAPAAARKKRRKKKATPKKSVKPFDPSVD